MMGTWIIILYFIVAYSISFLFVYSMGPFDMVDKLRNYLGKKSTFFEKLFDCMYCFPTWVGLGLSAINQFLLSFVPFTPFYILFAGIAPWYIILLLDMFATNGVVYILDTIVKRISIEEE